ncbi:hypothetical protein MAR_031226 [Mya arenaria]|uniref:Uncharacterized protein n=1 Tax=Mya arenaria TaxID=6604 RepID=A0ABY7F6J2_MYAAR|nr:hypothetical protein MAR_031226 [Mya arenaria]
MQLIFNSYLRTLDCTTQLTIRNL